jgi:hypothetical protein
MIDVDKDDGVGSALGSAVRSTVGSSGSSEGSAVGSGMGATLSGAVARIYSKWGAGANNSDIVRTDTRIATMIARLQAMQVVSSADGFCIFDSLAFRYNKYNLLRESADTWSAADVRAFLGQLLSKHQDPLLAFASKYVTTAKKESREVRNTLNARAARHKETFTEGNVLPRSHWGGTPDIKAWAIETGSNIFVVSTFVRPVTVLKYLASAGSPGTHMINVDDMGMEGDALGESVVLDSDIVLLWDGAHYNTLSWGGAPDKIDDDDAQDRHEEAHFAGDFGDSFEGAAAAEEDGD